MRITTRLMLLLLIITIQFTACAKKEDESIPPAIRAMIQKKEGCICNSFAQEFLWRNQTVYIFSCRAPGCDCMVFYYKENGESITMNAGYFFEDFRKEATFIREIWHCNQ